MKRTNIKTIIMVALILFSLSSCSSTRMSMREPMTRVQLEKQDFILSDQITAEAHSTMVFGIDWKRISKSNTGLLQGPSTLLNLVSIPVIGNYMSNKTANYSLYELMYQNPGYDVVFYPQYETNMEKPFLGLGFIYNRTTVRTTARLGKLKK